MSLRTALSRQLLLAALVAACLAHTQGVRTISALKIEDFQNSEASD